MRFVAVGMLFRFPAEPQLARTTQPEFGTVPDPPALRTFAKSDSTTRTARGGGAMAWEAAQGPPQIGAWETVIPVKRPPKLGLMEVSAPGL